MNPSSPLPAIDLRDRVALVTGGANGLGEGSALALARAGARIAIADKDAPAGERAAAAIRAAGGEALFLPIDLMDGAAIAPMVNAAADHFGRLDTLVNNVGGGRRVRFLDQSPGSIERHINLNLLSALYCTQAAVPHIVTGGRGGAIINVASTEALRAAPGFAVYAACKAGLVSFTKTMALELAGHNIRSHALAPDMIETEGLKGLMEAATEAERDARDRYVPLGRMGTVAEFGNIVAFLASDLASYLNGLTVPVDAGATAAAGWYRNPRGEWCLYHGD